MFREVLTAFLSKAERAIKGYAKMSVSYEAISSGCDNIVFTLAPAIRVSNDHGVLEPGFFDALYHMIENATNSPSHAQPIITEPINSPNQFSPQPNINSPLHNQTDPHTVQTPSPAPATSPPASTSVHPMITRTRDNTRRPRTFPDHVALLATVEAEPTTYSQANSQQQWRQAMEIEFRALTDNQTWTLVPPPIDQKVIGCKWVYKIKRRADGTIERYKARLVAKGFHQAEGIDYIHRLFAGLGRALLNGMTSTK